MSLSLSVQHLSGGETIIRPRGTVGTCGWSPLPWQAAILEPGETPEEAFLRVNPLWEAYANDEALTVSLNDDIQQLNF
jgi:hypothetical protein